MMLVERNEALAYLSVNQKLYQQQQPRYLCVALPTIETLRSIKKNMQTLM